ncbi:septal ring lytic transglycosylase RlpA family protein [Leptolyngbya sp. FACHB-402]|nr:septal ring lytic transglycosylase RlpA family protein [Leptolyngbya sp. FACHB-1624]MBD2370062.1 septal ring lytic transglycosylase RlpA family protein [Leptolyngbya sp. FACHB-161]MBD2376471.1 septal ring lytic transglycosylase RlpA family protein [Leptolyngbya sp. FACHB-238]MBD2400745.1 septal ring lytic transglycosylase RlpA family protein [Leptolyngbya sp. FACHB-239]MBD2407288.1 septal ring lytic transglycosylase RlpA family protein [Leptolyngbya sp. FACHB-402]MBN8561169.1 septal ring ly
MELGQPRLKFGDRSLLTITDQIAAQTGRPAEMIAIEWANNLRIALGQPSLALADAQAQMYGLEPTQQFIDGMASWYGPYFHGRQTANGEIFDQNDLTAAHPTLPLGTFLKVTNQLNGKSIVVRVNDRGPYFDNRVLDLSKRAAAIINGEERGVVPIEAVVMQSAVVARTPINKPPQQVARLVTGY